VNAPPPATILCLSSHHVGLALASPDPARVQALLESYMPRCLRDFHASMPPAESATD
jgi:hypothetical protein